MPSLQGAKQREDHEYGRFGWIYDPDGKQNRALGIGALNQRLTIQIDKRPKPICDNIIRNSGMESSVANRASACRMTT